MVYKHRKNQSHVAEVKGTATRGERRRRTSDVVGRGALAFAPRQREGGLALGLREAAGQLSEGFDEGVAFRDAHLPQLHLLASRPLLRHLLVHLTTFPQVRLISQHYDCHLRTKKNTHT